MRAITIRRNGQLLCFGPENGMYDPMVPLDAVKTLEPDYLAVIDEWAAQPVPTDPRVNARKLMRQSKTLPELIAALEGLL